MDRDRTLITLAVTLLLIVGLVPTVGLAQQERRTVLLDEDATRLGQVTIDGETYRVYRYENVLAYASGISIYHDGDRVRSAGTAEAVLTRLARRQAVARTDFAGADTFRTAARNVNATAATVANVSVALEDTLGRLAELRDRRTGNTTAWNASVRAAPKLPAFNETARETAPRLRRFAGRAAAYEENVTRLAALLEARQNGTEVSASTLYDRSTAALAARERLAEQLGFDGVDDALVRLRGLSDAIAGNVSAAPGGSATARHFERLHDRTAIAANRTHGLELPEAGLQSVRFTADQRTEALMADWRARRHAASDVYTTLGGAAVVLVAGSGYLWWRR